MIEFTKLCTTYPKMGCPQQKEQERPSLGAPLEAMMLIRGVYLVIQYPHWQITKKKNQICKLQIKTQPHDPPLLIMPSPSWDPLNIHKRFLYNCVHLCTLSSHLQHFENAWQHPFFCISSGYSHTQKTWVRLTVGKTWCGNVMPSEEIKKIITSSQLWGTSNPSPWSLA